MRYLFPAVLSVLISTGCRNVQVQTWKEEVERAERDFAEMAAEQGVQKAFLHFAAEDAVLMRNNALVKGRDEIEDFFQKQSIDEDRVSLEWSPDFVGVSASGDMAYTYGNYVFTIRDSTGSETRSTGVFHTVWKRQADGSWRFVWD